MRILHLSCVGLLLSCSGLERGAEAGASVAGGASAQVSEVAARAPTAELIEPTPGNERVTGNRELGAEGMGLPSPVPMPAHVIPSLAPSLQAFYDFEHPALQDEARELDQGLSGTDIQLINGGALMRVSDAADGVNGASLRVQQVDEANAGNDDWKAGSFDETGVATLSAFSGARGTTIMAQVQLNSEVPALNTNTADPSDRYNAFGIAGLLSGNSDGHAARALLELITVNGELRLVALGRRLDAGRSQTFAATEDYRTLLPVGDWVHVAATFDFASGQMALYRNGQPVAGFYTQQDDPWALSGAADPTSSPTPPRGIKIGGSYPQNTQEFNPGQSNLDSVMFIDRVATPTEIEQQYLLSASACDCH